MLSAYPACCYKEEQGYSIIFPDLNYLSTCGQTADEALNMAADCLAGYLYWLKKDGEKIPQPSSVKDISPRSIAEELEFSSQDFCENNAFVAMITVNVDEYAKAHFEKSVRKTLTIPAWLNKAALEQNINFSQVLQEALKEKLHLK